MYLSSPDGRGGRSEGSDIRPIRPFHRFATCDQLWAVTPRSFGKRVKRVWVVEHKDVVLGSESEGAVGPTVVANALFYVEHTGDSRVLYVEERIRDYRR